MSIKGNSIITAGTCGSVGPIGPIGNTGPKGSFNSATGGIGQTGAYIDQVISDLENNTITFYSSDQRNCISLFGFTGPETNTSIIRGVSSYINPLYFSALSSVIGGSTFEFFGISGSGTISANLSADNREILLSRSVSFPNIVYGNTSSNLIIYTTPSFSATTTKIGITGGTTNPILYFGLTAHKGETTTDINVYSDFTESYYEINFGITLGYSPSGITNDSVIVGNDNGGLILDLKNYTTYKIKTPIGITSIIGNSQSNTYQFYTLFIDGADVWNFPKNVKFDVNASGISGFGFLDGMNIVSLFSNDGGSNWFASFVAKGVGDSNSTYDYSQIGRCTKDGVCLDKQTRLSCKNNNGTFDSMKICDASLSSCILDSVCTDGVETSVCISLGGTPVAGCLAAFNILNSTSVTIVQPETYNITEKYVTYKRNTQNKNINNNCVSICCDGIEQYCQSLGDC